MTELGLRSMVGNGGEQTDIGAVLSDHGTLARDHEALENMTLTYAARGWGVIAAQREDTRRPQGTGWARLSGCHHGPSPDHGMVGQETSCQHWDCYQGIGIACGRC